MIRVWKGLRFGVRYLYIHIELTEGQAIAGLALLVLAVGLTAAVFAS